MILEEIDSEINKLFKKWNGLQPLKQEYQDKLNKKIQLEWNYNSNHIEGNTLTYGETQLLLFFDRHEGGHKERHYMEMKAHDAAINKIRELSKNKEQNLTEKDIREINQIILKEPFFKKALTPDGISTQKKIIPGEYKKQPNHVKTETGNIFKFAEPWEVPAKMNDLMTWFNECLKKPIPSIASFIAELHHRFILIHPFDDGNGRIARLWINYSLLFLGYPPLVIKSNDKENYFIALNKADTGDMNSFAIYLGNILIQWLKTGIKAAKGESIEDSTDIDKEVEIYIQEQENKGLSETILLSSKTMLKLCDGFLKPFLDKLEKKISQFTKIFEKVEIKLREYSNSNNFTYKAFKDTNQLYTHIRKNLIAQNQTLNKQLNVMDIHFEIIHKIFKGKTKKSNLNPFNIPMEISLKCQKYDYSIKINVSRKVGKKILEKKIIEKGIYGHPWEGEKIDKFVTNIKKDFFYLIKKD